MRYVEKIIDGYATNYTTAYNYSTSYPWNNTARAFDWNKDIAPNDSGVDGSTDWWNTYATVKLSTSISSNRWYVNGLTNWKSAVNENFDAAYDGTGTEYINFSCLPLDSIIKKMSFVVRSSMPTYAKEIISYYKNNTQIGTNISTGSLTAFNFKSTQKEGMSVSSYGQTWTRDSNGELKSSNSAGSTWTIGTWAISDLQAGLFKPKVELRRVSGAGTAYWHPRGFGLQVIVDIPMYTISDGSINGTIQGVGEFFSGKKTTLIAQPNSGYRFKCWEDGNTSSIREVTVNSDSTYIAYFEPIYVLYDTILNFQKWKNNGILANNGNISQITEIGFTLTSSAEANEGTAISPFFPVKPGKSYKIDIDIEALTPTESNDWDIYIFFCDENGTWIDFIDGASNRFSENFNNTERIFTAPNKTEVVKAQIRCDANGSNNTVKFSNFRIYPAEYEYMSSSIENAIDRVDSSAWSIPTPTRKGYKFLSWNTEPDGKGITYTSESVYPIDDLVLYSQWKPNSIFIGDKPIKDIYIGTNKIKEVYIGTTKIYGQRS